MAVSAGYNGSVVFTDLNGEGITLRIRSWSIEWTADTLETTNFDTSGPRSYIGGLTSWSGSFELDADSAQEFVSSGYATAITDATVKFYLDSGNYFQGSIIITSISVSTSVEEKPTVSVSFQGTGTLTQSAS